MKIYMIGIGGIGMSALAQLYHSAGDKVTGSDREAGPTTELLQKRGIEVIVGQKAENVPHDAELVVYSDSVPQENSERMRASEFGIRQISYFRALGEVTEGTCTIAVGGTHGKTTTTAMLTKILKDAGKNPTAIIGSIVKDFGSNFVEGSKDLFVVEACEYKDHILELSPKILVITNVEWDHTDWFKTEADMQATFQKAIERVPKDGKVIDASVYMQEPEYDINLIGEFNKNNARAAAAGAKAAFPDITDEQIAQSLKTFQGTWRRFEFKGKAGKDGTLVYDDYAHHPTAVKSTLEAVRDRFPDATIVVAFHPHLYSRTRDLMNEFALSFGGADHVLIAPIYAAREDPVEGVTSEALAERIGKNAKAFNSLAEVEAELRKWLLPDTIIITMGAGDIYKVADRLVAKS